MQEIITKESLSPEPDSSSKNINRNRIKIAFAIAGVLLFFGIPLVAGVRIALGLDRR